MHHRGDIVEFKLNELKFKIDPNYPDFYDCELMIIINNDRAYGQASFERDKNGYLKAQPFKQESNWD